LGAPHLGSNRLFSSFCCPQLPTKTIANLPEVLAINFSRMLPFDFALPAHGAESSPLKGVFNKNIDLS
jgi:hypothetical protein